MSNVVTSWPVVSLYDFCNPKQWPTIQQTGFVDQGYPVYGANGKIGHYTEFNHEKRTVLITCRGATCGTINVCEPKSYVTGNAMALDDLDESRVSSEYLVYALRNGSLAQAITGTAQPQITRQSLTAISIPLPPLAEQRRIAEVLGRAEALRTKRRAALAQLDSLTQSLFLDLFGDPGNNPKGWPRVTLGELIKKGPQNGLYKPSSDYGSGVPILRIDAFYSGQVTKLDVLKRVRVSKEECDLYGLRVGEIVINRVNSMDYLGKSALIPDLREPIVFESNMMRFDIDRDNIEPGYVVQFLQTSFIKGQILTASKNAVNQSSINQQDVKGFRINVPPLSLQREFARRVGAVEKLKTAQRASLAELDALFASLQHRAFRGEL